MKKNIIILISLLIAATSCIERNPGHFQDICGVYFNNTSGSMLVTDSLDVTFVYTAGNKMEIPVKVQLLGSASQDDRPVEISVSSDNAVEGVDFVLPQQPVLQAGASSMDYVVTLMRTEALKSEKKMICLRSMQMIISIFRLRRWCSTRTQSRLCSTGYISRICSPKLRLHGMQT